MAEICNASIRLCRIRATRLDQLGNPAAGPNNSYVSDKSIMLNVKPQIEAGADRTIVSGCDCIVAEYKGFDKLKRFDLELHSGVIEPALLEMLTGAQAIIEGGSIAGVWWPDQLNCSSGAQPNVAFEAWTDAWDEDHQANAPRQYIHWIWPSTHWSIADHSLQADFLQPQLNGYSRGNPNWGLGIYGDLPEAAKSLGGFFFTNLRPDAICDYQSHTIT